MKKYFTIGHRLPALLSVPLFGNREKFGLVAKVGDDCWKEWQKEYLNFYYSNQKCSVGKIVNDAGYSILKDVDFEDKKILEIGPGDINHFQHWRGRPKEFVIADISEQMISISSQKLCDRNIRFSAVTLSDSDADLPFEDGSFDVIISFYSLEHLFPLKPFLQEMRRVLSSKGIIVGAIPAEGGLAWGLGRFFTSRRWLKKNTTINPDKIICWEHPNFADMILEEMAQVFKKIKLSFWPLGIPIIDMNLVVGFIFRK